MDNLLKTLPKKHNIIIIYLIMFFCAIALILLFILAFVVRQSYVVYQPILAVVLVIWALVWFFKGGDININILSGLRIKKEKPALQYNPYEKIPPTKF